MDYLLGRNGTDTSYITGYGTVFSQNQHHRWMAQSLDATLPRVADGTIAGGPNSAIQDPVAQQTWPDGCTAQLCYLDDIQSWSTNEMTVNWNSALSWVTVWASSDEVVENGPTDLDWSADPRVAGRHGCSSSVLLVAACPSPALPTEEVVMLRSCTAPPSCRAGHRPGLLPTAGAGLVIGLLVLDIVLGLLPVAFVLATSVVVGQAPAAVDGGTGSAAWSDLVRTFVLAAVPCSSPRQVLAPVQTALGVRMQRRIDDLRVPGAAGGAGVDQHRADGRTRARPSRR